MSENNAIAREVVQVDGTATVNHDSAVLAHNQSGNNNSMEQLPNNEQAISADKIERQRNKVIKVVTTDEIPEGEMDRIS